MIVGDKQKMNEAALHERLSVGMQLAESKDHVLYENGARGIKITMGDLIDDQLREQGDWIAAGTAILLENLRREFEGMDETTKLVQIGDFEKYAFNMVRALFPSLALHQVASVQPMPGPYSMVFFMKFIYNATKGSALAGQDIIDNPNESYSDELIDAEVIGEGTGAIADYTGTLSYTPVKPGTVQIQAVSSSSTLTITDDGNGNLVGDVSGTPTINYATGAHTAVFSGNIDSGEEVVATYSYDMEGNSDLPEVDMSLTSSPVRAKQRWLRTRWSTPVQQDLKHVYGMSAEVEHVAAIAAELKFEIDREGFRDMKNIAQNSVTAFDRSAPSNISYTEHKLSFRDKLLEASMAIYSSTQRGIGQWLHVGVNVGTLLMSMPGFQGAPKPPNTRGIFKAGRMDNMYDVWLDPTYPGATRNTTLSTGYTMGYGPSTSMWEVGYIHAPYLMAFTTPTIMLDDGVSRKAIASRYGKKAVEGKFFCVGTVSGTTP